MLLVNIVIYRQVGFIITRVVDNTIDTKCIRVLNGDTSEILEDTIYQPPRRLNSQVLGNIF